MAEDRLHPSSEGPQNEAACKGGSFAGVELLEILVCPVSKTVLELDRERGELVSRAARLAYPIRDGVPIMLPEEARVL